LLTVSSMRLNIQSALEYQLHQESDKLGYNMRGNLWALFANSYDTKGPTRNNACWICQNCKYKCTLYCNYLIGPGKCLTFSYLTALICFRIRDESTRRSPLSCVFGINPGIGVRDAVMLYNGNDLMINNTDIRTEMVIWHILVVFANYRHKPIKGTGAVIL